MGLELTSNLTDLLDVKVLQVIGVNGMYCFPAMEQISTVQFSDISSENG